VGRQDEVSLERLSDPNFSSLLHTLGAGGKNVVLPIGSHARVLGDGGIIPRSEKLHVSSWKIEDENHQTFFIKQLRRQIAPQPLNESEQKRLDLDDAVVSKGRLAGISLFTTNLEESRRFYSRLLGLSITRDTGELVALGSNLVLRQNGGVTSVGEGTIIYVDVDDLRSCWQNLQRLSYANVSEIKERSQRSSFACRDPDGRTVEVFQR
jgi:predicted enzyme related to lactoylglutathione lyase